MQGQGGGRPPPMSREPTYKAKYKAEEVREAYLSDKETGVVSLSLLQHLAPRFGVLSTA
jgi:hypothetical protein